MGSSRLPGRAGCGEKGREGWEVRPLVSRSQGNRQRHRIWMTERHVDRKEMNPKATQDRWPSREPGTL